MLLIGGLGMRGILSVLSAIIFVAGLQTSALAQETETSSPDPAVLSNAESGDSSAPPQEVDPENAGEPKPADNAEAKPQPDAKTDTDVKTTGPIGQEEPGDGAPEMALVGTSKGFDAAASASPIGVMTYQIDLKAPKFRDIEPDLALNYSSQAINYGESSPDFGVGWTLGGVSSITRVAETGGVPAYEDGRDVFRLDGEDLLGCNDEAATSKLLRAYPDKFKTSRWSASCANGGKFAALHEDYKRIGLRWEKVQGTDVDIFVITDKDGVKYTYKPAGLVAGIDIPNTDDRFNLAFRRKFLLTEVKSPQKSGNTVTYQYHFGPLGEGLPERVSRITYGNYRVQFHYAATTYPRKTFATGSRHLGKQFHVLSTISMHVGGAKIRAFRLDYSSADMTSQRRLVRLREYGQDFVITGGVVTGGTHLPEYQFEMTAGELEFNRRIYTGKQFHSALSLSDLDNNGRVDINVFRDRVESKYSRPKGAFEIQNDRSIAERSRPLPANNTDFDFSIHHSHEWQTVWRWVDEPYSHFDCWTVVVSYYPYETRQQCGMVQSTRRVYRSFTELVTVTHHDHSSQTSTVLASFPAGEVGAEPHYLVIRNDVATSTDWLWAPYNKVNLLLQRQEGGNLVTKKTIAHDYNSGGCKYGGDQGQDPIIVGNFDRDKKPEVVFGETIFNVEDTNLIRSGLSDGFGSYCEKAHDGAAAVDLNGDGVDEILAGDSVYWNIDGTLVRRTLSNSPFSGRTQDSNGDENRVIRFGDVNGDKAQDAIVHVRNGAVKVYLSNGMGFLAPQDWITKAKIDSFGFATDKFGPTRTQLTDINRDGLADLILHDGFHNNSHKLLNANNSRSARVFLSRVTGFTEYTGPFAQILDFLGAGDIDGDGYVDMVSEGSDGAVYYNNSGTRNLLVKIVTPSRGEIAVSYMSTRESEFVSGDKVPGVSHVVRKIQAYDGIGQRQNNLFTYSDNRYDYRYRRVLGFAQRTHRLPKLWNETHALERVETFFNDHVGRAGVPRSSQLVYNGQVQGEVVNNWHAPISGTGPFLRLKTKTTQTTRFHTALHRTAETFQYNAYGEETLNVKYGPVREDGSDVDANDNVVTKTSFIPNLTAYIVNRPVYEWKGSGTALTWDRSNWVEAKFYHYDEVTKADRPWNVEPIRGNLTSVRVWNGRKDGNVGLRWDEFKEYDAYGNVIAESNARNARVTHEYDPHQHLFRIQTVNAVGHASSSTWNHSCQAKFTDTDVNGQVSTMAYDAMCRLVSTVGPTGSYERKSYHLASATDQYVETRTRSASRDATMRDTVKREYFDGLGRTYQVATSGRTQAFDDLIWTIRGHTPRNQLGWESIPLSTAEGYGKTPPQNKRSEFVYDPLERPIQERAPLGSVVKHLWRSTTVNGVPYYKTRYTDDPRCFDPESAGTVCGRVRRDYDYRDNLIKEVTWDYDGTDVTTYTPETRVTNFTYDAADRMTGVRDPRGVSWAYTYDGFGNRLTMDDPSLGLWTMAYDNADNLVMRRDAKGQVVRYKYDLMDRETEKKVTGGIDGTQTTTTVYDQVRPNAYNIGHPTTKSLNGHVVEYDYSKKGEVWREWHQIEDRRYVMHRQYRHDGSISRMHLPVNPGATNGTWLPYFDYDAGNRLLGIEGQITDTVYNPRGQITERRYANGWRDVRDYNYAPGTLTRIRTIRDDGAVVDSTTYSYYADNRIKASWLKGRAGTTTYRYDYAGRLLEARDDSNASNRFHVGVQSFSYDRAGRMVSNSAVGAYDYAGSPVAYSPQKIAGQPLTYDANGNLISGRGRTLTYDGENRLTSVMMNGHTTRFVYGADGGRLKKIENAGETNEVVTVYFGPVEIRDFKGVNETVLTHLTKSVQLKNGDLNRALYSFTDHLDSVRMQVGLDGLVYTQTLYAAFGEPTRWLRRTGEPGSEQQFLGEYYDQTTKLSFLNARYYDPDLGLFTQPDWLDVNEDGVGLNRYAYSFFDPINLLDPGGNRSTGPARTVIGIGSSANPYQPIIQARGIQLMSQINVYNYIAGRPMYTSVGNFNSASLVRLESTLMQARMHVSTMSPTQVAARAQAIGLSAPVSTARYSTLYTGTLPNGQGIYIGITYQDQLARRTTAHANSATRPLSITEVPGFSMLTRPMARVYEQSTIEAQGGVGRSLQPFGGTGFNLNGRNSVNPLGHRYNPTIDRVFSGGFSVWTGPASGPANSYYVAPY